MGRLDGKVALISGAARGQGEAEARLFAAEGARVVLGDMLDDLGEVVAKDIGDNARASRTSTCAMKRAGRRQSRSRSQSSARLTVLVNNAGILRFSALVDTPVEQFREVIESIRSGRSSA